MYCIQHVLRFFSLYVTEIFLVQRKIAALNNVESCPANSHFRFQQQHVVFIEWARITGSGESLITGLKARR